MRTPLAFLLLLSACQTGNPGDDDDASASITHSPPAGAVEGEDLVLTALSDGVDQGFVVHIVGPAGEPLLDYNSVLVDGGHAATIPGAALDAPELRYWIESSADSDLISPAEGAASPHVAAVTDRPIATPTNLRARWDDEAQEVEVTWTPPPEWDVVSHRVEVEAIGTGERSEVCSGAGGGGSCSHPGAEWGEGYTNWWVIVDDGDGGAPAEAFVSTDSLWNRVDTWQKETSVDDPLPFGTAAGEFNLPLAIAAGNDRIYVAEQQNHRVQIFNVGGTYLGRIGAADGSGVPGSGNAEFNGPSDISVGPDGRIYIGDFVNARVHVLQPDKQFVRTFGSLGTGDGQLRFPTSVAVDGEGFIHVAESVNHRVSIFDAAGAFVSSYDTVASHTLSSDWPRLHWSEQHQGMLISDGRTLLVRAAAGDRAIDLLADNSASTLAGLCETQWGEIIVAVDGNEQIGVDVDGHHVRVYDQEFVELGRFGGWGDEPGSMLGPSDCVVAASGQILVTDSRNHRVHVYGP